MTTTPMTELSSTVAPPAPGSMGHAPEPAPLRDYLAALEAWIRGRRTELDALDGAALAAGRGAEVGSDMALSLTLWKAVSERYQTMFATWDGGRVLQAEREQIAAQIWGRLDGHGIAVPEACRLSDALAAQLRTRLSLTPGADQAAARIRGLRAQVERIRDQVALEPALGRDLTVDRLAALMARVNGAAERAGRGADVGGLLAPIEQDAAIFERDLIVGNAQRREARDQVVEARRLRCDLEARAVLLGDLVRACVSTVEPAPRYAVPDVDLLGPVPNTPGAIAPYLERLGRVAQALAMAEDAYTTALAEHTDLVGLLDGYVAKARALGLADRDDLAASEVRAREVLARRPAPLVVCRQLVTTYQTWLTQLAEKDLS